MTDAVISVTPTGESADLLSILARQRAFLLGTVQGLSEEQARECPTASELCLGGLLKHVAVVQRNWARFAVGGAEQMLNLKADWADYFRLLEGETLAWAVGDFEQAGAEFDELVATLDLDVSHALPKAPWYRPGERWTVRRVVLHVLSELSQHCGHADIIRETIDGRKTMG